MALSQETAPNLPEVLYYYTGQQGLIGILDNQELSASQVQYLNDRSELVLCLKVADRIQTLLNFRAEELLDEPLTRARRRAVRAFGDEIHQMIYEAEGDFWTEDEEEERARLMGESLAGGVPGMVYTTSGRRL